MFDSLEKQLMPFNQSASNCIISSKSAKVTKKNNVLTCVNKSILSDETFQSYVSVERKIYFFLLKNECTRIAWIAAINKNEGTLPKNVYLCSDHFEEACFDKNWT